MVARVLGGVNEELLFNGDKVSDLQDEKVWRFVAQQHGCT